MPRKVPSWDQYFIDIASMVATRSKDNTQVGAVLVKDKRIVSTGYNGFPPYIDDNDPKNWEHPRQDELMVHAEINALDWRVALPGSKQSLDEIKRQKYTLYTTLCPCDKCAKYIIHGVSRVVYKDDTHPRFQEMFIKAKEIFAKANVVCEKFEVKHD